MNTRPIVVAFPFVGDEVGGSHISAINLIAGLDAKKITPLIVLHQPDGVLGKYLRERQIPFAAAPPSRILSPAHRSPQQNYFATAASYVASLPRLVSFLRSHNVQVVHTNDGQMHATWSLAARLAGARLLWHHRGDPTARAANIMAPFLANQIVTVSKFARPSRPILPIEKRVTVLHSPFDHPDQLPDRTACRRTLSDELGLPESTRFVGYFGSLIDRKRPVRFVEIIAAFARRYPDIQLHGLLFGKSEPGAEPLDRAVIERANELRVSDKVHLMGFRAPVAPLMCGVDALLVPAVNEPFGRTLIEAMLLGTPVVATNHGGNPEAIVDGQNGYLVKPEDPEAFVEPIHRLLTDRQEWQRISDTARTGALTDYGVDMHIEGITRIYERMTS